MNANDIYITLSFQTLEHLEEIQAQLYAYNPAGMLDRDDGWECYFLLEDWSGSTEQEVTQFLSLEYPTLPYTISEIPQQNWNEEWEATITPLRVTDRIVITPSWHSVEAGPHDLVLIIDPKMSFGTGYHATTRLMLRLLEKAVRPGDRVFDVGTGTGVLAIAAVKLGAASALGIDIDEWSIPNTEENIERNDVAGRVRVTNDPAQDVHESFDMVLSNITKNDNIQLLDVYARVVPSGGCAILSGFHGTDVDDVREAAERLGFALEDVMLEDEWAACILRH